MLFTQIKSLPIQNTYMFWKDSIFAFWNPSRYPGTIHLSLNLRINSKLNPIFGVGQAPQGPNSLFSKLTLQNSVEKKKFLFLQLIICNSNGRPFSDFIIFESKCAKI